MIIVCRYCSYKESIQEYPKEGIVQKRRIIISLQLLANCGLLLVDRINHYPPTHCQSISSLPIHSSPSPLIQPPLPSTPLPLL